MNYTELEFEKDSVFLVTGGAGFINSILSELMNRQKLGYSYISKLKPNIILMFGFYIMFKF